MAMNRSVETISTAEQHTVVGVFTGTDKAIEVLNELRAADFNAEQISVMARDAEGQPRLPSRPIWSPKRRAKGHSSALFSVVSRAG